MHRVLRMDAVVNYIDKIEEMQQQFISLFERERRLVGYARDLKFLNLNFS